MAVVAALQDCCLQQGGSAAELRETPFRIKWPNDIHAMLQDGSTLKVGGIICQSLAVGGSYSIVVGLGINVDNDEPTVSVNSVLQQEPGMQAVRVTREQLLACICSQLEALLPVCCSPALLQHQMSCNMSCACTVQSCKTLQVRLQACHAC